MAKKKSEVLMVDPKESTLLRSIVEATRGTQQGFTYCEQEVLEPFVAYVEINAEVKNDVGQVAVRANDAGLALFPVEAVTGLASATATDTDGIERATQVPSNNAVVTGSDGVERNTLGIPIIRTVANIPLPEKRRGGGRKGNSQYPFETMEVGESFFLPDGADFKAITKYNSVVSAANAKFSVEVPGQFREARTYKRYEQDVRLSSIETTCTPGSPEDVIKHKAGDYVLDEHGKRTFTVEQVPAKKFTKYFVIAPVADGAPWGEEFAGKSGAGIWRKQ